MVLIKSNRILKIILKRSAEGSRRRGKPRSQWIDGGIRRDVISKDLTAENSQDREL